MINFIKGVKMVDINKKEFYFDIIICIIAIFEICFGELKSQSYYIWELL